MDREAMQFRDTKYSVDKEGNVYKEGTLLKPYDNGGYRRVKLMINGVRKAFLVHRLIAEVYLGQSKLTVDHIDCDRGNNKLSNLQYMTLAENINKDRKYKELPMYISKYMDSRDSKICYRYVRRVNGVNKALLSSRSLEKVINFKLKYENNG